MIISVLCKFIQTYLSAGIWIKNFGFVKSWCTKHKFIKRWCDRQILMGWQASRMSIVIQGLVELVNITGGNFSLPTKSLFITDIATSITACTKQPIRTE